MADEIPSIINHVSIGTNDFSRATEFYDKVLAVVGGKRLFTHDGAAAYGKQFPELWVQKPFNGEVAETANGVHFCFFATSEDQVRQFHATAVAAGATDDGAPGPRLEYGAPYFGAFCRDLDGHKIEAVFWDTSKE